MLLEARNLEHYHRDTITVVLHTFQPEAFGFGGSEHLPSCKYISSLERHLHREERGRHSSHLRSLRSSTLLPSASVGRYTHGGSSHFRRRFENEPSYACSCTQLHATIEGNTIRVHCPSTEAAQITYLSLLPEGLGQKHIPQLTRVWKPKSEVLGADEADIISGVEDAWSTTTESSETSEEEEDDEPRTRRGDVLSRIGKCLVHQG